LETSAQQGFRIFARSQRVPNDIVHPHPDLLVPAGSGFGLFILYMDTLNANSTNGEIIARLQKVPGVCCFLIITILLFDPDSALLRFCVHRTHAYFETLQCKCSGIVINLLTNFIMLGWLSWS
jgi:hypothetical protein